MMVVCRATSSAGIKSEDNVQSHAYQLHKRPTILPFTDDCQPTCTSDHDHPHSQPPRCPRCSLIRPDNSHAPFIWCILRI